MNNRLLIYIVSYQRKSYTQGTIKCIHKVKPKNSQIIVCDNGSTDGTREWLEVNQEKYNLGLLFPEENLRLPGAWKLITNYFNENDFDYILPLDNDLWAIPNKEWFQEYLELFNSDDKIGSLGIFKSRKPGYFVFEREFDSNYNNRKKFNNLEYFDTVFYAGARLDKFSLWYNVMKNWPHEFIGDKIGRHYNSLGYRTLKILPGNLVDISAYNFNNESHREYNEWFYEKERDGAQGEAYNYKLSQCLENEETKNFINSTFGKEYLKFL